MKKQFIITWEGQTQVDYQGNHQRLDKIALQIVGDLKKDYEVATCNLYIRNRTVIIAYRNELGEFVHVAIHQVKPASIKHNSNRDIISLMSLVA